MMGLQPQRAVQPGQQHLWQGWAGSSAAAEVAGLTLGRGAVEQPAALPADDRLARVAVKVGGRARGVALAHARHAALVAALVAPSQAWPPLTHPRCPLASAPPPP